jgi:hypothetical protein
MPYSTGYPEARRLVWFLVCALWEKLRASISLLLFCLLFTMGGQFTPLCVQHSL